MIADAVEGLARSVQQGKVRRKDMDHALPDVKLRHYTGFLEAAGVAARIIEQDFVLTDVQQDRRQAGVPP